MPETPLSNRWIYAVIIAGLLAWAIFHAVGAYLFNYNPWRGVVVLACFAIFIGGWMLLLRNWNPPGRKQL